MEVERCGRCDKPVYFAEERIAGGKKWHATCFKCGLCKRSLEPTTLATFEGNIFCRHCYARKFGPKGYGFGIGAGVLGMDIGEHLGNVESLMTNKPHDTVPPGSEQAREPDVRKASIVDERRGSGMNTLRRTSQSSRRSSGKLSDDEE